LQSSIPENVYVYLRNKIQQRFGTDSDEMKRYASKVISFQNHNPVMVQLLTKPVVGLKRQDITLMKEFLEAVEVPDISLPRSSIGGGNTRRRRRRIVHACCS
jgi:hypothetical protein